MQTGTSKSARYFSSINSFIKSFSADFNVDANDEPLLNKLDSLVDSSYSKNSFSKLFYFLSNYFRPNKISEFGVLGCYSIISMALGAKNAGIKNSLVGYDLFEDYEYTSFALDDALNRIHSFGLSENIKFKKCNALKDDLLEISLKKSDLTHIDLSNEGNLYERVFSAEFKKDSVIVLEGGSLERDNNTWIKKYKAREISPVIHEYYQKRPDLKISVIDVFPSVTIIQS